MNTYVYKKVKRKNLRKTFRFVGLGFVIVGFLFGLYTLFPLLSFELYLRPAYASSFASPIPQTTILTKETLRSLINNSLRGNTWLPSVYKQTDVTPTLSSYILSIPDLTINQASVSTVDTDLAQHLVHFPGTAMPPNKGNAVIFGHSTLPNLYDPKNYKTIFANIHNLKIGDTILVTVSNTLYTYKITTISIMNAEETSYLTQDQDDSYLTIVTCTPPGTTWKRLILKARLEKV